MQSFPTLEHFETLTNMDYAKQTNKITKTWFLILKIKKAYVLFWFEKEISHIINFHVFHVIMPIQETVL